MSRTNKIILIISIVIILIIIAILIWWWVQRSREPGPAAGAPEITNQATETGETLTNALEATLESNSLLAPTPIYSEAETTVMQIASSFAERFGSFSNQSDFANLEDLKILMTDKMAKWADDYMKEQREKITEIPGEYYGMTTKALNEKVVSQSDNAAQVRVATQRREATGTTANFKVIYQDILIDLVKEGDVWKVDGAYWQEIQE